MLDEWLRHFLFISMRWLHIVCTTLVVGGTLFFEFVVPIAVEDLKTEQQLSVFGKARWVFKRVIWPSAFLLLISGATSIFRQWNVYMENPRDGALWAAVIHSALGIVALGIALMLTVPRSPPDRPIGWMRFNLGILLISILAASVARYIRQATPGTETPVVHRDPPETIRGAIIGPPPARVE
jgi:uncharacterized membrane protein